MKLRHTLTLASALLLAAGCAHESHQASYDEGISPYAANGSSRYANQRNDVTLNAGGTSDNASVAAGASENNAKAPSKSDNALATDVREALARNAEIAPIVPNIEIKANNGTVTLSGTVQSEAQKRQIESISANATGGSIVVLDDQLKAPSDNAPAPVGAEPGAMNNMNEPASGQSLAPTSNGGDNSVNRVYSAGDTNNIQGSQGQSDRNTNTNNSIP